MMSLYLSAMMQSRPSFLLLLWEWRYWWLESSETTSNCLNDNVLFSSSSISPLQVVDFVFVVVVDIVWECLFVDWLCGEGFVFCLRVLMVYVYEYDDACWVRQSKNYQKKEKRKEMLWEWKCQVCYCFYVILSFNN